jgi:hypothetical protein
MLIAGIILVNIVISVLLDEFLTTMGNEREVNASKEIELNEGGAIEVPAPCTLHPAPLHPAPSTTIS